MLRASLSGLAAVAAALLGHGPTTALALAHLIHTLTFAGPPIQG